MKKLKEYEAHVYDERTSNEQGTVISFCGEQLQGWYFTGPSHVIYNSMAQGRILPCSVCKSKILEYLKEQK